MNRQIEILKGAILLAELEEFGTFPAETQRYIRRSLDVALERADPLVRWPRSGEEFAHIRAQAEVYEIVGSIRRSISGGKAFTGPKAFFGPLTAVAAFDISAGQLTSFSAFRFLYERLLGAAARPWLPSVFLAAAAMPNLQPETRADLFASLGDALTAGWARTEATFYPEWVDC